MSKGKLVVGILGGVALGALAGLLLAPDKGNKTRKRILEKGSDLAGDLKGKLGDLYKSATNQHEELLKKAKKEKKHAK